METVRRFLKKFKTELPYAPEIPLLGISPKETKTLTRKDPCAPMFTAALFTIAKKWNHSKCPPMDEWIKKSWYTYVHTLTKEYCLAIKKKEILPSATTRVDLEGIMLSKVSQTKTNALAPHLHVQSNKKKS